MSLIQVNAGLLRQDFETIDALLEGHVVSLSWYEVEGDDQVWTLQAICNTSKDVAHVTDILSAHGATQITVTELGDENWLAKTAAQFPPFSVGPFYLYGSHVTDMPPQDKFPILIDAATAFGSGEHPTTQGCLEALDALRATNPAHILDLGCGSGILALAASHLWPQAHIEAVDNDPEAVRVAHVYAERNNRPNVHALESEGFVQLSDKRYDLILANILAGPLIALAPEMPSHLSEEGHVVLSGLLESQSNDVLVAYQKAGFDLVEHKVLGDWATLTILHS